jgi:hypothetical protein
MLSFSFEDVSNMNPSTPEWKGAPLMQAIGMLLERLAPESSQ